jgi:uncharacterized membrane protein YeaQ/YmgE (transglycosylase-associated protein family)
LNATQLLPELLPVVSLAIPQVVLPVTGRDPRRPILRLRGIVGLLAYLILLAISGLFVGALARLALPGPDPMTIPQTILLGLAGNFIAGVIVWLLWAHRLPGLLISVACSSVILYFIRRSRGGGLARPGAPLR